MVLFFALMAVQNDFCRLVLRKLKESLKAVKIDVFLDNVLGEYQFLCLMMIWQGT